jgi:type I restriction enzyme R subunit
MSEHELSERDICTRYITPAIQKAGWPQEAFREEVRLTDGRVSTSCDSAARSAA